MSATAKLFMHGRSQAVRLPKEFRFEGTEVRVRRVGKQVILEPMAEPYNAAEFWAKIDAIGGGDFPPIERDQPPMPDDRKMFD
jgi:antitoxin VapB